MLLLQQDNLNIMFFKDDSSSQEIKSILDNTKYNYFTINDIEQMLSGKVIVPYLSEEFAKIIKVEINN